MSGTFTSGSITSTNTLQMGQVQALLTRFEVWTERIEFVSKAGEPTYEIVDDHLRLHADGSGSCVLTFAKRLFGPASDADLIDARIFHTKTFCLSFSNLVELDRILKTVTKLFSGGATDGGFEFDEDA